MSTGRQGAIRRELTGRDIVLLLGGVHQTAVPVEDTQPQLWRRYLGLLCDGMRARAAPTLPHPPPRRFEFTGRWSIPDPSDANVSAAGITVTADEPAGLDQT